jgi:hypothetical protein
MASWRKKPMARSIADRRSDKAICGADATQSPRETGGRSVCELTHREFWLLSEIGCGKTQLLGRRTLIEARTR